MGDSVRREVLYVLIGDTFCLVTYDDKDVEIQN